MGASQLKTWLTTVGTVTRIQSDGSPKQGCGLNKRLYAGRISGYDYRSHIKPAIDWTDVGKVVRAVLVLYTDDGLGRLPIAASSDVPKFRVRRLTSKFTVGNNTDDDFDTGDYTAPTATTSGEKIVTATKEADGLIRVDITSFVDLWAPSGVKRSNGATGSPVPYHGLSIVAATNETKNAWAGWSENAVDTSLRPFIELTYEYGKTTPDTPTSLTPNGNVPDALIFTGTFSDIRATDKLAKSQVQIWSEAHSATGEESNNVITDPGHGLLNGARIYFTSLTGGTGLTTFTPYYVFSRTADTFKVAASATTLGIAVNITVDYSAMTWRTLIYDKVQAESNAAIVAAVFSHQPSPYPTNLAVGRTYSWRARVYDQEGEVSGWSALTNFVLTNTAPNAPALTPLAKTYATLDGVLFRATFVDAQDTYATGYQMQLSAYPSGSPQWDDPEFLLWDTGKRVAPARQTVVSSPYGGRDLVAGTYYWRAKVWDSKDADSAWTYTSIVLTADFEQDPSEVPNAIQMRPRAPWRLVIKEMKFNAVGGNITGVAATNVLTSASAHGLRVGRKVRFSALTGGTGLLTKVDYYVKTVPSPTTLTLSASYGGSTLDFTTAVTAGTLTAITTRGPGNTVAVIEDAYNVGASLMYNSPGEAHWTLGIAHPQLPVIEPRQTHYSIEFRQGDGWREIFAGLVMDFDASDTDVVFYGTDYLGLLDFTIDEHYDPANIEKSSDNGGSKYVNKTISAIVTDQLKRAREPVNSPVGFISTGTIATMGETVTVYSTYQQTLPFVTSLIDSHKAGTGKRTRLFVQRTSAGAYRFVVQDDPGVVRDNMRMRYGELVQGYRVVPFGGSWGTRVSAIGRDKNGVKVRYATSVATGIDENVWGRWNVPQFIDGVADANDMTRRTKQAVLSISKLGKSIALGLRSGVLQPRDGYELLDQFPVDIEHGSVSTDAFGSGYWVAVGITWQALQRGDLNTTLTLHPREDTTAPDGDLLGLQPLSEQSEWQIGWNQPGAITASTTATSRYWLDQTTGKVYVRTGGALVFTGITGTI